MKGNHFIFIHGYGSNSKIFNFIRKKLKIKSYSFIEYSSESYMSEIEENIENLIRYNKDKKIIFITHSMGALLLNFYGLNNSLESVERIVLISPPLNSEFKEVESNFLCLEKNEIFLPKKKTFIINSFLKEGQNSVYKGVSKLKLDRKNDGVLYLDDMNSNRANKFFTIEGLDHFWILFSMETVSIIKKILDISDS